MYSFRSGIQHFLVIVPRRCQSRKNTELDYCSTRQSISSLSVAILSNLLTRVNTNRMGSTSYEDLRSASLTPGPLVLPPHHRKEGAWPTYRRLQTASPLRPPVLPLTIPMNLCAAPDLRA